MQIVSSMDVMSFLGMALTHCLFPFCTVPSCRSGGMAYDSSFWATEKAQFKTHCKTQKDHFNNMNTQTHTCLPQYLKMQAIHEVKQKRWRDARQKKTNRLQQGRRKFSQHINIISTTQFPQYINYTLDMWRSLTTRKSFRGKCLLKFCV